MQIVSFFEKGLGKKGGPAAPRGAAGPFSRGNGRVDKERKRNPKRRAVWRPKSRCTGENGGAVGAGKFFAGQLPTKTQKGLIFEAKMSRMEAAANLLAQSVCIGGTECKFCPERGIMREETTSASCMFEEDKQNIKNKNMLRSEPKPMKRKVLAVLLSLCMLLPLLPVAAFAAEDLTFGEGETAKTFTPVLEGRMSVRAVDNTTMVTGDGTVTYTINAMEGEGWVQNSGEGSNQAYTYVGLYVAMPDGAVSLKRNRAGNPEEMGEVDAAFLKDGKYQSWYPVAEGLGGDNGEPPFSLFSGGQEYTVLLEWYGADGKLLENGREYVKVTRELGEGVAKVQVGELTYATFEAALEAALEANPTRPEVTLLADVDVSLELPAGVELTVNTNFHTLTNTNADYVCVKGDETEEGRTDVYKLADTLVVGTPVVDEEAGSVTTNVNGVLPADKTAVEVSVTTGAEGAQNGDVTSSAVDHFRQCDGLHRGQHGQDR